jgi:hypothetical protein
MNARFIPPLPRGGAPSVSGVAERDRRSRVDLERAALPTFLLTAEGISLSYMAMFC